jgi:hypothetical protein
MQFPSTFQCLHRNRKKTVPKFIWKHKRLQIRKLYLNNKSSAGNITILNLKLYYIAMLTITEWGCRKTDM